MLGLVLFYWYRRKLPRVRLLYQNIKSTAQRQEGYIYVLSNRQTFRDPRIHKIGNTGTSIEQRLKKLHTSLPYDFKVELLHKTSHSKKLEKLIHSFLSNRRVRSNREFFWLNSPEEVTKIVEYIEHNYVI